MLFRARPGATQAIGGSRGGDAIVMADPPTSGGLERLCRLAFRSCGERRFPQSQPQHSAPLILRIEEIEGHVVVVDGLARSSSPDRPFCGELRIHCPARTIAAVGKMESQLCEQLSIFLVRAGFQNVPDETVKASLACGRHLIVEVRTQDVMAERVPLRRIVANYPCLHRRKEPFLDQFLVLACHLCKEAAGEGTTEDRGWA